MVLLLVASLAVARVAVAVRVAVLVTHGGKLSTLGNVRSIGKNFLVAYPLALVLLAERVTARKSSPPNKTESDEENDKEDKDRERQAHVKGDITGRGRRGGSRLSPLCPAAQSSRAW